MCVEFVCVSVCVSEHVFEEKGHRTDFSRVDTDHACLAKGTRSSKEIGEIAHCYMDI